MSSNNIIGQSIKAAIVGIESKRHNQAWPIDESIAELKELCENLNYPVVRSDTQARESPHIKCYVGTGKLKELASAYREENISLVVTDDDLSPAQHRNLEDTFKIKVMDRTGIILEIFAMRAKTKEAQLQVELAQLSYMLPRLTRMWTHLSRQSGGVGTKGPGEKQLEVDKRQVRNRIDTIKKKLVKIEQQRGLKRERRRNTPILTGSIVGYTNAGKSTLLNAMTASDVKAEDKLFATLDPTTKTCKLPDNQSILLTDTVGFIQKLPQPLKTSFKATLEEINDSSFVLHVVDISNPQWESMLNTSKEVLDDIGATELPTLYVFNKIDKVTDAGRYKSIHNFTPNVSVSALQKDSLKKLFEAIQVMLKDYLKVYTFRVPLKRMDIVHLLHQHGQILSEEYEEDVNIEVKLNKIIAEKIMGQLEKSKENRIIPGQ